MADPFPAHLVPMLAKLAKLPASDEGWAAEVKWDGVRAIAYCRGGRLALETRNLNDVTAQYPEVQALAAELGGRDAVLDGELVAFDADGKPSFGRLQQRMHLLDELVVRARMREYPVTYVVFDLLYFDGHSLLAEPYARRRRLLEGLELDGPSWQVPGYSTGHLAELLAASAAQELEGIVLKRLDSSYAPGKRNGNWLKVKNLGRQEFVIGGWQGERAAGAGGSARSCSAGSTPRAPSATRARSAPASPNATSTSCWSGCGRWRGRPAPSRAATARAAPTTSSRSWSARSSSAN